jgi:hypothetical protein
MKIVEALRKRRNFSFIKKIILVFWQEKPLGPKLETTSKWTPRGVLLIRTEYRNCRLRCQRCKAISRNEVVLTTRSGRRLADGDGQVDLKLLHGHVDRASSDSGQLSR